jgi:CRISPR-associated protein Csm3
MDSMKLIEIRRLKGEISLLSGLHIGSGSDEMRIGGIDKPVIKNAKGIPYIPGSSLKGKVRSLLEWANEAGVKKSGEPLCTSDSMNLIARIFGNGAINQEYDGGPTRVCFRDAPMVNAEELRASGHLTEAKTEISMNRRTGAAKNGGLHVMERVPAGARFEFEVSFKIFDFGDGGKRDREAFAALKKGLEMLEADSLGGAGSRGYGRIKLKFEESSAWQMEK